MDQLRIRAFDVRFGDAIFVAVPDRDPATGETTVRHVLVDMGNVLRGPGGDDAVFKPAYDAIAVELGGKPLDLYVMTHEHLDHVQGLFYVKSNFEQEYRLMVDSAWLTASSAPGYYDAHPKAKEKRDLAVATYRRIAAWLGADEAAYRSILANNDPDRTGLCVDFLRKLAKDTWYVHRGTDLAGKHPFKEARFAIWAPEEDTSSYYGRFQPLALDGGPAATTVDSSAVPLPPPGVDAGAFYGLVDQRRRGFADNLLAIDQAANNTSVVFTLEWRGWRLLFCGDAEIRSWKEMKRQGVLDEVDVVKVSHHGSHNGTPDDDVLDVLMPADGRRRYALISSCPGTYGGIPHTPTNDRWQKRAELHTTVDGPIDLKLDEQPAVPGPRPRIVELAPPGGPPAAPPA